MTHESKHRPGKVKIFQNASLDSSSIPNYNLGTIDEDSLDVGDVVVVWPCILKDHFGTSLLKRSLDELPEELVLVLES